MESERLRLLGFRIDLVVLEMACFAPKAADKLRHRLPTDPPIAAPSNGFACLKPQRG